MSDLRFQAARIVYPEHPWRRDEYTMAVATDGNLSLVESLPDTVTLTIHSAPPGPGAYAAAHAGISTQDEPDTISVGINGKPEKTYTQNRYGFLKLGSFFRHESPAAFLKRALRETQNSI